MQGTELLQPQSLARADWQGVLSALAQDMDPWAVDLVELVRRFRAFLESRRALELEVPSRMVLAGSVLLRMKSDWLRDEGAPPPTLEEVVDEVADELPAASEVFISPEIRLPLLRRPRARVSLPQLRRALVAALAHGGRKEQRPAPRPEDVGMSLSREPFTRRTARLLRRLLSLVNGNRTIPFRQLLSRQDPGEQVARFVEVLHLDARGKLRLFQGEFLGELFIELPDDHQGAG
ncbi:MAG: hypothetical protein ACP5G2_01575 [Candidatus Bipolaricaulaceae bacterium]